jgi:putative tryptophan/tyrosine transport system substrate-binding protein
VGRAIADRASRVSPHDAGDCGLVQEYACGEPATMCGFRRPVARTTSHFRLSIVAPELGGKRLEMLKEMVPGVSSVAVLLNNKNPQSQIELKEMWSAARAMGLQLYPAEISTEVGLEDAFAAMKKAAVQALVVLTDPILFSQRKRTVDLANKNQLPAMYFFQGFAEDGGLMSYGPSDADLFRRTAGYVDRILKGAKPGDLPIEQPTRLELFINLKAAKMLGVIVPESFLLRADKVIE